MTTPDRNQDLLTGPPGCGKMPVIRRLIERLGDHVRSRSRHRVGRYGVEPEQLAPLVQEALAGAGEVDVYLVDEVGKMEMLCPAFVEAVPRLLDGAAPVMLTIAQKGRADRASQGSRRRLPGDGDGGEPRRAPRGVGALGAGRLRVP